MGAPEAGECASRKIANPLLFPGIFSVDRVHERWVGARVRLQRRLQLPLSSRFAAAEFAVRETTVTKSTKTVIETRKVAESSSRNLESSSRNLERSSSSGPDSRMLEECLMFVSGQLVRIAVHERRRFCSVDLPPPNRS